MSCLKMLCFHILKMFSYHFPLEGLCGNFSIYIYNLPRIKFSMYSQYGSKFISSPHMDILCRWFLRTQNR